MTINYAGIRAQTSLKTAPLGAVFISRLRSQFATLDKGAKVGLYRKCGEDLGLKQTGLVFNTYNDKNQVTLRHNLVRDEQHPGALLLL